MNKIVYLVSDYITNEYKVYADEMDAVRKALRIYQAWLENYSVHVSQSKVAEDIDTFIKSGYIKTVCCVQAMPVIDIGEEE